MLHNGSSLGINFKQTRKPTITVEQISDIKIKNKEKEMYRFPSLCNLGTK